MTVVVGFDDLIVQNFFYLRKLLIIAGKTIVIPKVAIN